MSSGTEQASKTLVVENKMGIHARPASKIVRVSNKYSGAELMVEKDGEKVDGKSIMSLMMLAAGKGSSIKFVASGEGAEEMLCEIEDLFKRKFDEE
ncbi:MAG: HPr family phosphocarrier protein [Opitutales bacterium]|nr:HPr family phosphocarrier protein [Opitutales bacterium]